MENLAGNTILITGGGSGIGLALGEEFAKLGNTILVAGRSTEKLKVAQSKGFKTFDVDVTDPESIQTLARRVIVEYPELNAVIHNAGIMKYEDFVAGDNRRVQEETIATNLLGPMRLTDALLPHLLKKQTATIFTVSSGLAFVPIAMNPTYCATKAAIHSYSQSLRYQLRETRIDVIEIVPPYVQTSLKGPAQAIDPNAMPLKDFVTEVIEILKSDLASEEIVVKRAEMQRHAECRGRDEYQEFFNRASGISVQSFHAQIS